MWLKSVCTCLCACDLARVEWASVNAHVHVCVRTMKAYPLFHDAEPVILTFVLCLAPWRDDRLDV